MSASIRAGKQIVLAVDGDAARRALGRIVARPRRASSKQRVSAVQRACL
jgi:hypothetical protein